MDIVMNNKDLRKLIFSYLRKYPKKVCFICERVCVWDKKVRDFLTVKLLQLEVDELNKDVYCNDCINSIL